MLVKTGLLVISNPKQISQVFMQVSKRVQEMLYVQLMTASLEHFGNKKYSWPSYSQTIRQIYSQAAIDCRHLDVRVLLSGLKFQNVRNIKTQAAIDLVIFDRKHDHLVIDSFIKNNLVNVNKGCGIMTIAADSNDQFAFEQTKSSSSFKHTVLGGTFDRIHIAHKLLLNEAALHSNDKVTIGVTEENMLASKTLWELAEPLEIRMKNVHCFLRDICPELNINVVPINDPMGPTKSDPTMDLLIVSQETLKGGDKVNDVRKFNGLSKMQVLSVELVDEPHPEVNEESKISSSTARMRLLGRLLKEPNHSLPIKPYIIGLTGGIASGKSGVAERLQQKGALVINCDLVAHQMYLPGTDCYRKIVEEFGSKVVKPDTQEIDRKELGAIVFSDKEKMEKLNRIVWPMIAQNVQEQIRNANVEVIVVEAAILLTAGWQQFCHEVWTTLVPPEEAIKRLQSRNGLSAEQALTRVKAQANNMHYVSNAHVVLCTLWDFDYTGKQVERAWRSLMQRIECRRNGEESRSSL